MATPASCVSDTAMSVSSPRTRTCGAPRPAPTSISRIAGIASRADPYSLRTASFAAHRAAHRSGLVAQYCRRSEEHTSELQSLTNLVCRLLLEKKKITNNETDSKAGDANAL